MSKSARPSARAKPSSTERSLKRKPRGGRPCTAEAEKLAEKILDAGWDLLLEGGFDGFTFDRLARLAHTGKATIYARFANKRDFLRALMAYQIERRQALINAQGTELPLIEAFQLRATEVLNMLLSDEGVLFERLVDWLDREGDTGPTSARALAYRNALDLVERELSGAAAAGLLQVGDVSLAARFWLEGILGHARLAGSEGQPGRAENQRWVHQYAEFFFSGFRPPDQPAG